MKSFLALAFSAILPGVNSAVTFYNDRDQYLAALGNANIVEATARRTSKGFWAEQDRIEFKDFEQCGLKFQWGGETDHMNYLQRRFGEHTGERKNGGDASFKGGAVWWMWLHETEHDGYTVETEFPFYAMGFDAAGSGSQRFGIKNFGEDVQYYNMPRIGSPAQFFGWISDGEPVNIFEIESEPGRTNIHGFAFTNVAYATPDDQAVTSVGCYNKNPASRSCWATGWGDPHLITWDGLKFDVHAKGEVVMTRSMDSGFEIQARLQGLHASSTAGPAVTTGIVVKDPGFPTLQVNIAATNSTTTHTFAGCPIDLYVNNQATDISSWEGVQGSRVILKESAGKVVVEYVESNIRLDMRVKNYRGICLFSVDYFLADCYNDETLIGLLGSPDGDYSNDWMTPSNEVLPLPEGVSNFFFEDAYTYSVDNWCLRSASESFFTYESDEDFYTYANCGNAYDPTLEKILDDVPAELDFCNGDIGCILDGVEIGADAAEDYEADPAVERTREVASEAPSLVPSEAPSGTPPSRTESNGDPHFRTWKNEHFEFHGQCDVVMTSVKNFANRAIDIDIHIRTKIVRYWSYIESAAIRIGNDVLEVKGSADKEDGDAKLHYWSNFEYLGDLTDLAGFPVTISPRRNKYTIDLGDAYPGQKIVINTFKEFVGVKIDGATEESFGESVGMNGDFKTGKTLARDGVTEIHDYNELGNEWQVLPSDGKLFHDLSAPQFPEKCFLPEDARGERTRRLSEQSVTEEAAEAACAGLEDEFSRKGCVYDILATQDIDMVGAY